jgi:hypothetical protein
VKIVEFSGEIIEGMRSDMRMIESMQVSEKFTCIATNARQCTDVMLKQGGDQSLSLQLAQVNDIKNVLNFRTSKGGTSDPKYARNPTKYTQVVHSCRNRAVTDLQYLVWTLDSGRTEVH